LEAIEKTKDETGYASAPLRLYLAAAMNAREPKQLSAAEFRDWFKNHPRKEKDK
jgi:hypothetical protein